MNLPRRLLLVSSYPRQRAFCRDVADPAAAAARVWRETWWQIEKAPFWRARMGPPGRLIPPLSAFPITDYETYRAAIEASFGRPISELSGDPIRYWAVTASGAAPGKLFPLTDHFRAQCQRTSRAFLHGLARRFVGLLRKPVLSLAGEGQRGESPAGIPMGHAGAHHERHAPEVWQKRSALVAEPADAAEDLRPWRPLYALASDLSAVLAVTPAQLLQFLRIMVARIDSYWPILAGRKPPPPPLPPVAVGAERLARLRRALSRDPPSLREIWPSLQFVSCWKSSTSGVQIPALERHTQGRVPIVDGIYAASEGWMSVPEPSGRAGGPLHPGAHVVEFLPEGAQVEARNLVPGEELEEGALYEVVITTSMGLVRYRLMDLVRCTGRRARTPIIEFEGRVGSEIWLGPARVREAELGRALAAAGVPFGDRIVLAPSHAGDRLELCHAGEAGDDDAAAVDRALREIDEGYDRCAAEGTVRPVQVRRLSEGHPAIVGAGDAPAAPRILLREPVAE